MSRCPAGERERQGWVRIGRRTATIGAMPDRRVFYWKPTCTTCRGAREFLRQRGIEVEERDINRDPPSRAFLERHIGAKNYLEYVSRRSPVFKQRPLPASKREAIDLMIEQPNLIKRPVLVDGSRVVFGFDRKAYDAL
jgi:Spx/MgsR family transcriptional regulator